MTKNIPTKYLTKAFQGAAELPVDGLNAPYNWHALKPEHKEGWCHLVAYYDQDYNSYHVQRFVDGVFVGNDQILAQSPSPQSPEDILSLLAAWEETAEAISGPGQQPALHP